MNQPPTYDLTLILDPAATDERRAEIVEHVRGALESQGTIEGQLEWGSRPLAYEIRHKQDAEYHFFQFKGPAELLDSLNHTLRITDGIVRYRIIKSTGPAMTPMEYRPEERSREDRGDRGDRAERGGYRSR
jgi:small subunit ribosomal protein S6